MSGLCLLALILTFRNGLSLRVEDWLKRQRATSAVVIMIIAALAVVAAGRFATLNFPLSLDEFWVDFDATAMAHGRLLVSVAPEWRTYVPALQPIFRLDVPDHAYWISNYLPMNAAISSLFMFLGQPEWAGICLAGVALVALAGVARHLWPARPDAAIVSVALLASSPQFLITAMTPYAMTAHLALNLVWLWLFLRDTRFCHALALIVAFVACGLHQIVFHPLFVAPFILALWLGGRWKLAACYTAGYAVIGLFWILYWSFLLSAVSPEIGHSADVGLNFLLQRVFDFFNVSLSGIILMVFNSLRFLAWQNMFAVPLACVGIFLCRDWRNPLAQLAAGIALTFALVAVLMPFQGHGWGYRYLHGYLGSMGLLAASGWVYLTDRSAQPHERPAAALALATVISLVVMLPWYAYQAQTFVKPYASAVEAIRQSRADLVLVDPTGTWYGLDLVRNDPFLRNTPKVLGLPALGEAQVHILCRRYDVAVFDRRDAERFGIRIEQSAPEVSSLAQARRDLMAALNCGRRL
jgi:hypothetical protein